MAKTTTGGAAGRTRRWYAQIRPGAELVGVRVLALVGDHGADERLRSKSRVQCELLCCRRQVELTAESLYARSRGGGLLCRSCGNRVAWHRRQGHAEPATQAPVAEPAVQRPRVTAAAAVRCWLAQVFGEGCA